MTCGGIAMRSRRKGGGISLSSNTSTDACTPTSMNRMSNTLLPCRLVIYKQTTFLRQGSGMKIGKSSSSSPPRVTICLYSEPDILSRRTVWTPGTPRSPENTRRKPQDRQDTAGP